MSRKGHACEWVFQKRSSDFPANVFGRPSLFCWPARYAKAGRKMIWRGYCCHLLTFLGLPVVFC